MTLSEELNYRGFIHQTTYKDLSELDNSQISFYFGVDPSAESMTIGNLAAAMLVKCFIKHDKQAYLLVGGATGLIGDPDGKADERNLKTTDEIDNNKLALVNQYKQLFGEDKISVVDNYDWFSDIKFIEFLRDVGKHVPMRQMLAREFVNSRLSEDGAGISYAEFSYVLIQAYDFCYLNMNHGVALQLCGADQWGNCIAGVDLIRRKTGNETNVLSMPLIINKQTGVKFGKTEEGAVWLDSSLTSPTKYYQFWVNTADEDVETFLKIYTELSSDEITEIINKQADNYSARLAQKRLAYESTKIVHGEEAAKTAEKITAILVGDKNLTELDDKDLNIMAEELVVVKTNVGMAITDVIVQGSLASSKTEARRLISEGAISINNNKVQREQFEGEDLINNRAILRKGKAFKDSIIIEKE